MLQQRPLFLPTELGKQDQNRTLQLLTFSIFSSSILKNSCWLSEMCMLKSKGRASVPTELFPFKKHSHWPSFKFSPQGKINHFMILLYRRHSCIWFCMCARLGMVTSIHTHPEETSQPTAFPWARKAPSKQSAEDCQLHQHKVPAMWDEGLNHSLVLQNLPAPLQVGKYSRVASGSAWVTPQTIHTNQIYSIKRLSI